MLFRQVCYLLLGNNEALIKALPKVMLTLMLIIKLQLLKLNTKAFLHALLSQLETYERALINDKYKMQINNSH